MWREEQTPTIAQHESFQHSTFEEALERQERLFQRKVNGDDTHYFFFVEHDPVYTHNERANLTLRVPPEVFNEFRFKGKKIPVISSPEVRGGGTTYHGPGQLVCYMVVGLQGLDLSPLDVGRVIDCSVTHYLRSLGIETTPAPKLRGAQGIWVGRRKIMSRGIRISKGITRFGFALNVSTDLEPFDYILPCGLPIRMTSIEQELGGENVPDLREAANALDKILRNTLRKPNQFCGI